MLDPGTLPSSIMNIPNETRLQALAKGGRRNAHRRYIKYMEEKAKGGWGLLITEDYSVNGNVQPFAPSAIKDPFCMDLPREMTIHEIHQIVRDFGATSKRAKESGFDGIEIHAAHGYLISSFLSPFTNKRVDEYGGCFENRTRILDEIYACVRENVENIRCCIGCLQGCEAGLLAGTCATCLVNPRVGRECENPMDRTDAPKKVMVIGGGPAGLMAEETAAKMGHDVTVY